MGSAHVGEGCAYAEESLAMNASGVELVEREISSFSNARARSGREFGLARNVGVCLYFLFETLSFLVSLLSLRGWINKPFSFVFR